MNLIMLLHVLLTLVNADYKLISNYFHQIFYLSSVLDTQAHMTHHCMDFFIVKQSLITILVLQGQQSVKTSGPSCSKHR